MVVADAANYAETQIGALTSPDNRRPVTEFSGTAPGQPQEGKNDKNDLCLHFGKRAEPVPYALAISLEVAEPLEVSIFEQVRERIRPQIEIETAG